MISAPSSTGLLPGMACSDSDLSAGRPLLPRLVPRKAKHCDAVRRNKQISFALGWFLGLLHRATGNSNAGAGALASACVALRQGERMSTEGGFADDVGGARGANGPAGELEGKRLAGEGEEKGRHRFNFGVMGTADCHIRR